MFNDCRTYKRRAGTSAAERDPDGDKARKSLGSDHFCQKGRKTSNLLEKLGIIDKV